jgi:hypothetical protein
MNKEPIRPKKSNYQPRRCECGNELKVNGDKCEDCLTSRAVAQRYKLDRVNSRRSFGWWQGDKTA